MGKYIAKKHLIEVEFWDHSANHGDHLVPVKCRAWGVLIDEDDKFLHLATWLTHPYDIDEDTDAYLIFKPAIIRQRRLATVTGL
jgi:hypothetical protein